MPETSGRRKYVQNCTHDIEKIYAQSRTMYCGSSVKRKICYKRYDFL